MIASNSPSSNVDDGLVDKWSKFVACCPLQVDRCVKKRFKSVKFPWHLPQINKSSALLEAKLKN